MDDLERGLVRKYLGGYRITAEINGRVFDVLYSSRFDGDLMPWVASLDPALRFTNKCVIVRVVYCRACGTDVGPGIKFRADFPAMDLCERHAVAELAGDLVQIEKGTMK